MKTKPEDLPGRSELGILREISRPIGRRRLLAWGGVTLAVLMAGCDDDEDDKPNDPATDPGDPGLLNLAYALEQLDAAYFSQVVSSFYLGATAEEMQILTDIRDHEVIHRDFLAATLGGNAIGTLEFVFTSVDFTSRDSVLANARAFEDLSVSAYNGAGRLMREAQNLILVGKIASVEARHASVIRDLIAPKSSAFAGNDVVDPATGLDIVRTPQEVLTMADPFVVTPLDIETFV